MKRILLLLSILPQLALADPGDAYRSSTMLFELALSSAPLSRKIQETPGAEIISVGQVFILQSRESHTNYEVRFGIPDGAGGYSSSTCFALRLVSYFDKKPIQYFVPADEPCRSE